MKKKFQKKSLVLKIIALELVGGISLSYEKNTWRSADNVLKDVPYISDPTKRHDTQLTLVDINGKFA